MIACPVTKICIHKIYSCEVNVFFQKHFSRNYLVMEELIEKKNHFFHFLVGEDSYLSNVCQKHLV